MKQINHFGFGVIMLTVMAVSLVAIGLAVFVVERDIVRLTSDRPTITIPVSKGQVAGITAEQSRMIIDRGSEEVLSVEFPLIEGMTVADVLKQITNAFELELQVEEIDNNAIVIKIGDLKNGDTDKQWQYSIDDRTPLFPMNQRIINGGETIAFEFVSQR